MTTVRTVRIVSRVTTLTTATTVTPATTVKSENREDLIAARRVITATKPKTATTVTT